MTWSEYEQNAWRDIQDRKRRWYETSDEDTWAKRTGGRVAIAADKVGGNARKIPGAGRAVSAVGRAGVAAQELLSELSSRTLSERLLLRAYERHGLTANALNELRSFDLERLDKVVGRRRLNMFYGAIAGVEGAAAGLAVTGGTVAAGTGVAAAPGFGAVAVAMAGDAGFVLALSSRAVADTAMHFGFDPNDPKEQVFIMSVINVGSAVTQSAKYTALADLSKLTQALVRSAPWIQLNQFALSRLAATFAQQFGFRLTKQKLGQLIPFVGIGVGASLNYATISRAQAAAYWAYRERLLIEKNPKAIALMDAGLATYDQPEENDALEPTIEILDLLDSQENDQESVEKTAADDADDDNNDEPSL